MTKQIIFGLAGTQVTSEEKKFFSKNEVEGFILFKRNIDSKEQLIELVRNLKNLYPHKNTPIFVDQEGGRVARIKPPIVEQEYPPLEIFGKLYDELGENATCNEV